MSCASYTIDACDETASVETHPSAGIFNATRFADYGDAYLSQEFSSCGYFAANLAGIAAFIAWLALGVYILNLLMVGTDLALYFRNKKLDKLAEEKKEA